MQRYIPESTRRCEPPSQLHLRAFNPDWSVAIFSAYELPGTLASTLAATRTAAGDRSAVIDVVVNGNPSLANWMSHHVSSLDIRKKQWIRVWHIPVADKAHSWNQYVHQIRPGAETGFFLDGYARAAPDAFYLMADGLKSTPEAMAASGVPGAGRSAGFLSERFLREKWISGNCFALRGSVLEELCGLGFRVPVGTYYHDSTITTAIHFNLDPSKHQLDRNRILVHPKVTWTFRPLSWYRPADIRALWRRTLRQAQGILEVKALRFMVVERRISLSQLPDTVFGLIEEWRSARPREARAVCIRKPLCRLAMRRLRSLSAYRQVGRLPAVLVSERLPFIEA